MPCKADAQSAEWIDSNDALAETVATWGNVIALDTEFLRSDTFFPLPGLYQVNAAGRIYLLDPLAIDDWSGFVELLENPSVVVVMHACSEDLELMRHHIGAVPNNVFDTQLANAFVSSDFSTSYARLVADLLGVDLAKHETRSDWRARPLTERQIRYATEDVVYLPKLHQVLQARLQESGREAWFAELMRDRGRYLPGDPEQYYRNNKRAWKLSGEDLAVLQRLTAWRERTAMTDDVPRKRIVWDEHLIAFARMPTLAEADVRDTVPKSIARRYSDVLIEEHRLGRAGDALPRLEQPLTAQQAQVSKQLREKARDVAERLGLSPELLARKRDIESCLRAFVTSGELSDAYQGWRAELLGSDFLAILEANV